MVYSFGPTLAKGANLYKGINKIKTALNYMNKLTGNKTTYAELINMPPGTGYKVPNTATWFDDNDSNSS